MSAQTADGADAHVPRRAADERRPGGAAPQIRQVPAAPARQRRPDAAAVRQRHGAGRLRTQPDAMCHIVSSVVSTAVGAGGTVSYQEINRSSKSHDTVMPPFLNARD